MRKKTIIAIMLFFITTGCTVDYEITLDEKQIDELISINENIDLINEGVSLGQLPYKTVLDNIYSVPQPVYTDANINPYNEMQIIDGVDYYNKNMNITENQYGLELTYKHKIEKYQKVTSVSKCYKNISVLQNNGNLVLSTSRENLCFKEYDILDAINVTLTFDNEKYDVVSHNADKVNDNKYIWNINRQNYTDKSVVIELIEKDIKKKQRNEMIVLIGFIVLVIIGAGIVYIIAKKQNESKNKI